MKHSMKKNGMVLGMFALICTTLVALVNNATIDQIKRQEELQLIRTLNQIIPHSLYDNELFKQCVQFQSSQKLGHDQLLSAYIATRKSQPVAIALEAIAPDGYNGNIKLIMGILADGTISGVQTLTHQETPGLGDKIEQRKSNWTDSFSGLTLSSLVGSKWKVKKDGGHFDQFTGATITPRAYVNAVHRTLEYFNTHQQLLFSQKANCDTNK